MDKQKLHFQSLDALRFFSFLLVFLNHIPKADNKWFDYFNKSGGIGVSFFFVLSGFLISFILLNEKRSYKSINYSKFLFRRALRILPLFYAMILFAFFTPLILSQLNLYSSDMGYTPNWFYSALFLENYQMIIHNEAANVSPLGVMWSLCIEIHFYILWGLVFKFISIKKIPSFILGSIFVAISSRLLFAHFNLASIDLTANLDYFAYGCLAAYIFIFNGDLYQKFQLSFHKFRFFIFALITTLIFLIPNFNSPILEIFSPSLIGILFASLILYSLAPSKLTSNRVWLSFAKLGTYTYGLYLFHTIIVNLVFRLNHFPMAQFNSFSISLVSFVISLLISILSYHQFEIRFLKLKKIL